MKKNFKKFQIIIPLYIIHYYLKIKKLLILYQIFNLFTLTNFQSSPNSTEYFTYKVSSSSHLKYNILDLKFKLLFIYT